MLDLAYDTRAIANFLHELFEDLATRHVPVIGAAYRAGVLWKTDELSSKSLNHLRALVHLIYAKAVKRGKWTGTNPAAAVERRKVIQKKPEYLRPEEVMALIVALAPRWRPLFATAVPSGMRKGELLGLRKTDVNVAERTIMVARSYEHETTKGGHADLLPIPELLVPFLQAEAHRGTGPTIRRIEGDGVRRLRRRRRLVLLALALVIAALAAARHVRWRPF